LHCFVSFPGPPFFFSTSDVGCLAIQQQWRVLSVCVFAVVSALSHIPEKTPKSSLGNIPINQIRTQRDQTVLARIAGASGATAFDNVRNLTLLLQMAGDSVLLDALWRILAAISWNLRIA
jgi:hypothetical protein